MISRSLVGRAAFALGRTATLADLMDRLAELHGDAVMVTEELQPGRVRELTYTAAAEQVRVWSAAVAARTRRGQPVVVATPNGVDQFLICLAVARAGGLPAPVNPQMTSAEIEHVIADSGAALIVRDAAELSTGPGSRRAAADPVRPERSDVAALFYTSGTTGRPKGAELTHQGLVGQVAPAAAWPFGRRGDELALSLPVAHIMGFLALMGPAVAGIPVYFMARFSPQRVLSVIEERRCSAFMGVPAMYRTLIEAGAASRDLSSVRVWISGADVMPAELAKQFKRFGASASLPGIGAVGQAAFLEGYGMVEVSGNVATKVSPPMLPIGLGDSLGLSMPGWRLRVADREGRTVLPGQVGELLVKGPGVLTGYWGDQDATDAALTADGWLRTGDLVRSGPLGTVLFHGRAKAVIKSGGYSVYPLEIEASLEEHPDVLEAAVVGMPDSTLGEVPVAVVRLDPSSSLTGAALQVWAAVRLAQYKTPRRVVVVEELPRTGTRKVPRNQLLPLFAREGDQAP